jgi:putative transposase
MSIDNKVEVISEKMSGKAKAFGYRVRLSTYEKGRPVYMPIEPNKYFDGIADDLKKFYQENLNEKNEISISFIKESQIKRRGYVPAITIICT